MALNGTKERLTKEAVRRELAAEAAQAQIAKALEAKDALERQARANAACAIKAVEERRKLDQERHAMELALAQQTLEEAKLLSTGRIQAAEALLLKTREEGRARVEAAEQGKQRAVAMAKDVAAESNALNQARIEDAKRRTEQIESLMQRQAGSGWQWFISRWREGSSRLSVNLASFIKGLSGFHDAHQCLSNGHTGGQVADAEKRQAFQLREAEDRAAHVEKEARLRAEASKQTAASIIQKQVQELQLWVSQTEDEVLRTHQRLEMEQGKAQKMIGKIYVTAESLQHRGEVCQQQAQDMLVETSQQVSQMISEYHEWRAEEMEYIACQVRHGVTG